MNTASANAQRYRVPFQAIVPFLLLTFGLAWGLLALLILFPEFTTQLFGAISNRNPLFNPFWPDAQPDDTLLLIVAAIVMTGLTRKTMFHQGNAVTEVIPQMQHEQFR